MNAQQTAAPTVYALAYQLAYAMADELQAAAGNAPQGSPRISALRVAALKHEFTLQALISAAPQAVKDNLGRAHNYLDSARFNSPGADTWLNKHYTED